MRRRVRRVRSGEALQNAADETADAVVLLGLGNQLAATAGQRALRQPFEAAPHDPAPELRRQRAASHLVHRCRVVVAEPDAGHQLGREADEPGVAEVLAGAGLAGRGAARLRRLAGAPDHRRRPHVAHLRQMPFRYDGIPRPSVAMEQQTPGGVAAPAAALSTHTAALVRYTIQRAAWWKK